MRREWTPDELAILREGVRNRQGALAIVSRLHEAGYTDRTAAAVSNRIQRLRVEEPTLSRCAAELEEENAALRARVAELEERLRWALRAHDAASTGGRLTIRASDHHYGDASHLLRSCGEAHTKTLELIRQYQPREIQLVLGDDWIAGRGIYKTQDLHAVLPDPLMQARYGAVKFREWLSSIRQCTSSPVIVYWLSGNHDMVSPVHVGDAACRLAQEATRDIADLSWNRGGLWTPVNVGDESDYVILMSHGFGYSHVAPHAKSFIEHAKSAVIRLAREGVIVQRVASGHTHWVSTGLEHVLGLPFDSTGGWQRNERVRLGLSQRTPGLLVYVAIGTEVLEPIVVQPSTTTLREELDMPFARLLAINLADAARALDAWEHLSATPEVGRDGHWA